MTRTCLLLLVYCCWCSQPIFYLIRPTFASGGTAGDSSPLSGQPNNSSQYHNNDNGTDVMTDQLSKPELKTSINTTAINHFVVDQHSQPININPNTNWASPEKISSGLDTSLRIDQVQKSDEGTYLCIANSPSGTLNGTARLRVTEKVKPNYVSKPLLPAEERNQLMDNDGYCQDFHSNVCGKFVFGHRVYVTREFHQAFTETQISKLPGLIMNCARLPQYSLESQTDCRRIGDHDVPSSKGQSNTHTATDYWGTLSEPSNPKELAGQDEEKSTAKPGSPVHLRGPLSTSPDFVPIFVSISALILFGILILGICFLCRRTRDTSLQLRSEGTGIFRRSHQNGSSFGRLNSIPFDASSHLFRGQGVGSSLDTTASKKRRVPGMGSGIKTSATARLLNSNDENYCMAYSQVTNTVSETKDSKVGVNGLQQLPQQLTPKGGHASLPGQRSPLPASSILQRMTTYHQYEATNCVDKSLPPPNGPAPPPPLSTAFSGYQRSSNNSYSSSTATNPVNDRSELFRQAPGDPIFSPVVNRSTTDSRTAYTTLINASPRGQHPAEQIHQVAYPFSQGNEQQVEKPVEYAISQLRFGEQFGQGVFGPVYKAELLPGTAYDNGISTRVIVKTLSAGSPANLQNDFKREAELISNLDHPNVLSLLGVSMQHPPWCMIFEIPQYLDLRELMSARRATGNTVRPDNAGVKELSYDSEHQPALSEPEKLRVLAQVAAGMDYLSSHRFVHRDLAARNVIIVNDVLHCKITDLGLARDCYANDYFRIHPHSLMLPIRWMPLDSIMYGKFTVESDIWAFGVLMWEIWSDGGRPYSPYSDIDVLDLIRARQVLPNPPDCPVKVSTFMHHCWADEPDNRPTFKDCIYQIDHWQIEGTGHDSVVNKVLGVNSPFSDLHSGHYHGNQQVGRHPFESINSSTVMADLQPHYTSIVDEAKNRIVGDASPAIANKYSGGEISNDGLLTRCSPHFSRQISQVSPDGSSANGTSTPGQCLPCALPNALNPSECSPKAYYDSKGTFLNFGIQLLPNTGNIYLPSAEPVI